jgi:hypothetical protein
MRVRFLHDAGTDARQRKNWYKRADSAGATAERRTTMANTKERHTVAFVLGAALGGAIGAIFGLMNAPRPGAETRADLTERWHDVEERTAQEIANLETEVRDRVATDVPTRGGVGATVNSPTRV